VQLQGKPADMANKLHWMAVYGAYVESVLAGPAVWLGLVEISRDAQGHPAAFRLTELGAWLLAQRQSPPEVAVRHPNEQALSFSKGGDLILHIESASAEITSLVTRLCVPQGGEGRELRYRPDPAGAARLFASGETAQSLLAALERAAGAAVPEAIWGKLKDWSDTFGEVHLYGDVALLEFGDDYILRELLAATTLAQHMLYRFSPRLVAVRPEGVEALRAELVKKGYTPKVNGA
jgi:hypothetical protein